MNRFPYPILVAIAAALAVSATWAQHSHHGSAPSGDASDPRSSYAGEQTREIKALSPQEQRAWQEGEGGGLARAAELNSHPGPMHVLELASKLNLTPSQERATRILMDSHKAQVRALGAELVELERGLDDQFRVRGATEDTITRQVQRIGSVQARIRAAHLITHLEQTRLLRPEQITAYDRLRGYTR